MSKLVISGALSSILLTLIFLTTSFFTKLFSLLESTETVINLSASNLSTLLFKLLKPLGTLFHLSISNLSKLDFRLAEFFKSVFDA